jgi:type IV secretory pathway TrbF-like protein
MIGERRNQAYLNRGALDRAAARFSSAGFFASLGLNFFLAAGLVYVGSLPREKPVVLVQHDNGTYTAFTENATPNDVGIVQLLSHWFVAFRIGSTDARSMGAQQVAALIPSSGDVKNQVSEYNQALADSKATVSPNIRSIQSIAGSPFEYEIDFDETVTAGTTREVHSMVAYVTIAFDDSHANLHSALLNPYGLWIQKLHVSQIGSGK